MNTIDVDAKTIRPVAGATELEERAVHRLAYRYGFTLAKLRVRRPTIENEGGYAIKNTYDIIFWGQQYELDLAMARAISEDIIAVKRRRRALLAESLNIDRSESCGPQMIS